MKRLMIGLILIISSSLFSGCFSSPQTIRDIRELKQDHRFYIGKASSAVLMMDPEEQKRRDQEYNVRHFSPWHRDKPQSTLSDIVNEFDKYGRNRGYGENGRKYSKAWIKKLKDNARLDDYSGAGYPAITIDNANMRALPTNKPHFNRSRSALSGYPFDNLQVSTTMANTPVYVSHVSRDKAWVFVETGYYFGWLPARDVAATSPDFMKTWQAGRYAVIIKDKTALYDTDDLYLFRASLGAVFPLIRDGEKELDIYTAVADVHRRAVIRPVKVAKTAAAVKPLQMTTDQMAGLANELTNEPYGWGGLYGNRDCSAMIRDLFAPFGIWLPRNSTDQARNGGTYIDLSALSAEEKEKAIIAQGVPYLTLLWRKGHIMLYMGVYEGSPLVFHNFWGVSTRSYSGRRGKVIVGHAAVTTLHPGQELFNYDADAADLAMNIRGMILLAKPSQSPQKPFP